MSCYPPYKCPTPSPRIDATPVSGHYCDICGGLILHAAPSFTLPKVMVKVAAAGVRRPE